MRVLTALDHEAIPITADGAGFSLTPAEAELLAQVGELRRGFCELGYRQLKLADKASQDTARIAQEQAAKRAQK